MSQGITEASAYQAMLRACKLAKVPHYSPHSLRHRPITIGISPESRRGNWRNEQAMRGRR